MNRGRFITIEGVEGVGKSTNLTMLETLIKEQGFDVLVTREPGGTATGERVRAILLDKEEQKMTAMTELLLMFAVFITRLWSVGTSRICVVPWEKQSFLKNSK